MNQKETNIAANFQLSLRSCECINDESLVWFSLGSFSPSQIYVLKRKFFPKCTLWLMVFIIFFLLIILFVLDWIGFINSWLLTFKYELVVSSFYKFNYYGLILLEQHFLCFIYSFDRWKLLLIFFFIIDKKTRNSVVQECTLNKFQFYAIALQTHISFCWFFPKF